MSRKDNERLDAAERSKKIEQDYKKMDGRVSLYADQQQAMRNVLAELEQWRHTTQDQIEQHGAEMSNNARRCSELERHMSNVQGQANTLGQRSHANQESIHVLDKEVLQLEELTAPKRKLLDRVRCAWREFWGE